MRHATDRTGAVTIEAIVAEGETVMVWTSGEDQIPVERYAAQGPRVLRQFIGRALLSTQIDRPQGCNQAPGDGRCEVRLKSDGRAVPGERCMNPSVDVSPDWHVVWAIRRVENLKGRCGLNLQRVPGGAHDLAGGDERKGISEEVPNL